MVTTITGMSTSGIWFTRSFFRASRPSAISAMMMTIVETGRLMLKSDRNMESPLGALRFGAGGVGAARLGGGRGVARLDRLAVLEERGGIADHLVAFGQPRQHGEFAGARIAIAQLDRRLLQLVARHAPRRGLVAVAHDRRRRHGERAAALGFHA